MLSLLCGCQEDIRGGAQAREERFRAPAPSTLASPDTQPRRWDMKQIYATAGEARFFIGRGGTGANKGAFVKLSQTG